MSVSANGCDNAAQIFLGNCQCFLTIKWKILIKPGCVLYQATDPNESAVDEDQDSTGTDDS